MAIVQNKTKKKKVVTKESSGVPKGLEDCMYLKANKIQLKDGKTHTRPYKKRVMATNPISISEFLKSDGGVKDNIKFMLPEEFANGIYEKGFYTIIRIRKPGKVKVFNTKRKEISARPFILHAMTMVEGMNEDQIVELNEYYNSTRPLAYRFLRSLKSMLTEQVNNE